jgi:prepilin-type N-terminal cleavage/methylation domain-containing protein
MVCLENNEKGFTLIELLVVISIVGLLSSVVLASLNAARGKAQTAAGQKFSTSLYSAYGAEAIAMYNFDEAANTPYLDSANSYNLTVNGTVNRDSDTPNRSVSSVKFIGDSNVYLVSANNIPLSPQLNNSWTISTWVKATISSPTELKVFLSFGLPYFGFSNNRFYFSWNSTDVAPQKNIIDTQAVVIGTWYHVAATHSGNNTVMYVNGREVARNSNFNAVSTNLRLYLGRHSVTPFFPFTGFLDDTRIYSQSLVASDIQRIYAEGKDKYMLANNN